MPDPSSGFGAAWFTFGVRGRDDDLAGTTRRALLITGLAGSAVVLAGCRHGSSGGAGPHPTTSVHPLESTLSGALSLVTRYDAAIAGQPGLAARLTALRAEHWTHVTALTTAMGRPVPSGAPSQAASATAAGTPAGALADLRAAERSARSDAVAACLAAPAKHAELLGSIAACRATHQEVPA